MSASPIPRDQRPAAHSGTFVIGGDRPVHRLGFGTMRLTGAGVWGEPTNHAEAIAVLRRAVGLGITLIDTADSYGPEVAERLIAGVGVADIDGGGAGGDGECDQPVGAAAACGVQ